MIEAGLHSIDPTLSLNVFSHQNITINNYNPTIPTKICLHGDFKYDNIQNTDEELKSLEEQVIARSKQLLQTGRLIVLGYSGNDNSIMSILEEGLKTNLFPNGIIWCKLKESNLNERVTEFMEKACMQNQNSAIVSISGFDILLNGQHYLGCSQMFDSAGNGMRLFLKELYDPKFIEKKPYMRSGDAFKIVILIVDSCQQIN